MIECGLIDAKTISTFIDSTRADGRIYLLDMPLPFTLAQMRTWAADFRARGVCPTGEDVARFQQESAPVLEVQPADNFFEIQPTPAPRQAFGDEDWDFLAECGTIPADALADILDGREISAGIMVREILLPFTRAELRAWVQNWRVVPPRHLPLAGRLRRLRDEPGWGRARQPAAGHHHLPDRPTPDPHARDARAGLPDAQDWTLPPDRSGWIYRSIYSYAYS